MIYFTSGHTAKGFVQIAETNVQEIKLCILLRGGGDFAQMECLEEIEQRLKKEKVAFECIRSPWNAALPEGLIVGEIAIWCSSYVPKLPAGTVVRHAAIRPDLLSAPMSSKTAHLAYDCFRKAHFVRDEWESIFVKQLNKEKADQLAKNWMDFLIPEKPGSMQKTVHRFLGAATPSGTVDCIPQLTADLSKRIFIKGRPGSGKSTFMKKIARAAEQQKFETEVYHCSFNPESIDMVIVRELGFALFDSNAPHEYFPENNQGDQVIDMYKELIKPGTDEQFAKEIELYANKYAEFLDKGTAHLLDVYNDKKKTRTATSIAASRTAELIWNYL